MVTTLEKILSWSALPVYVWQGLKVRRASTRLAPPDQKFRISIKGKGKPIRVLMVGDSSVAGVGVDNFDDCLSGRLPVLLSEKSGRPVEQRTCGNNSATAGQILNHVIPNLETAEYEFIILNIGVNDSKNFHSGRRFKKEFGALLYALNTKFPGAKIIWQGLIDLSVIPVLPYPLNRILGIRSRILREIGVQLCRERIAFAPDTEWKPIAENWSVDGFHASAKGYESWAEELSDYMLVNNDA